jgi:hypothetical protein
MNRAGNARVGTFRVRSWGSIDLSSRRRTQPNHAIKSVIVSGIAAVVLGASAAPACAQNFFEALFGRFLNPSGVSAYADPNAPGPEAVRPEGSGTAYCVRLCDGRYFPIQRHAGVSPAQMCSSFCPASATKIFSGGSIEHALASDGKRYSELGTAFVYREKLVAGCTCNGRDALGLVNTPVAEDPTLRPGDIVATNTGLMAYAGPAPNLNVTSINGTGVNATAANGIAARQASFTPIDSYSGLSPDLRRQLTGTKIAPATERPAVPPPRQAEAAVPARPAKTKRAQTDR